MPYVWIKKHGLAALVIAGLGLSGCGQAKDQSVMADYQASIDALAAQNLKTGQDFLAATSKEAGVVTLPSGLMYKVVADPDPRAPQPAVSDSVTVHYEGRLVDGTVFDSSYARNQPATFPLSRVVEAWQIGIPLMHKGDTYMLYVPASLGYGERDMGDIPPNSTLIFKVQLIGIDGK